MLKIKRRECERFEIPNATLTYKVEKSFFTDSEFTHDMLPIYDISRGGIRFLSQIQLKMNTPVLLKIFPPNDENPLIFKGKVTWFTHHPGKSYDYQVGIQFSPYGDKKGLNPPECLSKLKGLEKRYLYQQNNKDWVTDNQ